MTDTDHDPIERFVRGTLGCHCPDEVFRSVAINRLPGAGDRPPVVQLLIGSRLLIHVVAAPPDAAAAGWLEQLAVHGRSARDRHGYNRFRLVVTGPSGATTRRDLESRFARTAVDDDRAHLHLLGADALPAGLAAAPAAAQGSQGTIQTVAK